jgi:oligosaccharyltransferase complex subunit alpha (ribophorin I)
MSLLRTTLLLALLACFATVTLGAATSGLTNVKAGSFVNTELDRTIDLRTHIEEVTLAIKAKNTGSGSASAYIVAVPAEKAVRLAYVDASAGKQKLIAKEVALSEAPSKGGRYFQIDLPKTLAAGESASFNVFLVFTRTQRPFPEMIEQQENQLVMWEDSSVVFSPYTTSAMDTTVKLASKQVESYTKKGAKKSADQISYKFSDVPAFDSRTLAIHFVNNSPFATFNTLSKDIEVSHWGNVAVQDNYVLTHTGAKLRGAFTRFDYERSHAGAGFRTLVAELPRTAKDIYYRDVIGNVSTSKVRKAQGHTRMEVDPRFPMFGGWESDFHIGYNLPSQHYLSVDDSDAGHYVLNITFASPFASAAVDDLAVRVILPEGAHSIEWRTPFDIDSAEFTEFKTYLDTTGRPTLILRKANCVRFHQQHFQVSYRFAKASILREPLLIAAATLLCLLLVIVFTHADLRITDEGEAGSSSSAPRASSLTSRRQGTDLGSSVQTILENLLAEPNGLLAVSQERQVEKQALVASMSKELQAALKEIETEEPAFAPVVNLLLNHITNLQKASRKYVSATGGEMKSAREGLAAVVEQIQEQAAKLAQI